MVMSHVLFYSALVLNLAGILFSGVYLWINVAGDFSDMGDRNANTLRITRLSMIISIVFALLTSLLSNSSDVAFAIQRSALLFAIIGITWLAVILACIVALLITLISKTAYRNTIHKATSKLFAIAIPGAVICLVLNWLFS